MESCCQYHLPRRFKVNSKVHRYLAYHSPGFVTLRKRDYNLYEVILALKKLIVSEKLYDPQNPTVILCNEFLEDALEVKALHVTEVKDFVIKQMPLIDQEEKIGGCQCQYHGGVTNPYEVPSWASNSANAVVARANVSPNFDLEAKYYVKPGLLKVLHSIEGVNPLLRVFQYRKIADLLSGYILSKRDVLFDERNIKIAMVENDPLGEAFGVKAFARCQVTSLLRAQLLPIPSDVVEEKILDIEQRLMEIIEF